MNRVGNEVFRFKSDIHQGSWYLPGITQARWVESHVQSLVKWDFWDMLLLFGDPYELRRNTSV
jgi:hypothetical protein